jgi:hypothetical protein
MIMEQRLSPQQRMQQFTGWQTGLGNRIYHLMGHLTFGPVEGYRISFENADRRMKAFIQTIKKSEDVDVGCFYTICRKHGRVHIHFLMILQRQGKTFFNIDPRRLERLWPHICEIEQVISQQGAINYLASQFLHNDACHMEWYNGAHLRRSLIKPETALDPRPPIGSAEEEAYYAALNKEQD